MNTEHEEEKVDPKCSSGKNIGHIGNNSSLPSYSNSQFKIEEKIEITTFNGQINGKKLNI